MREVGDEVREEMEGPDHTGPIGQGREFAFSVLLQDCEGRKDMIQIPF